MLLRQVNEQGYTGISILMRLNQTSFNGLGLKTVQRSMVLYNAKVYKYQQDVKPCGVKNAKQDTQVMF